MTENHFRLHFSQSRINTQHLFFLYIFFTKRPFWMTENHFRSHFSPFQHGRRQPFWITGKKTFDRISRHFRSIRNFFFFKWPPVAILEVRFPPKTIGFFPYVLSKTIYGAPYIVFGVINGYAKYEVDRWIYDRVREPRSFLRNFFTKWPPEAILFFRLMPKIIGFL